MMETLKDRLLAFLENLNIGQTKFEENVGISRGYVNNLKGSMGTKVLSKIADCYPDLNKEWLLTGKGEMLLSNSKEESKPTHENIDKHMTYLLPISAMGGSLSGFNIQGVTLPNCEAIVSPIENVDFAITVYGESMSPEYPSGSRVLIKKINPDVFIDWGKTYVLDTSNGIVIKEIQASQKEGCIKCVSINPDPKFQPFDVPMKEVYGMYRVLMCMAAK